MSVFALLLSWSWFSDPGWARLAIAEHSRYWQEGFGGLLGDATAQDRFRQYLQVIDRNGYSLDLLLHLALPLITGLGAAGVIASGLYQPGGVDSLRPISGPVLYRGRRAVQQACALSRAECAADPLGPGIALYPGVCLSKRRETENLLFLGMPGSGKSQLIQPIIQQVIERGDRCLIYDEKKEYTERFYRKQSSLLIAPWDARSAQWDIAADCRNNIDAQLIAERTIPVNEREPIWGQGARLILVGGLLHCINTHGRAWGWRELAAFLALPESAMAQALRQAYPLAAHSVQEGSKTTHSLLMNLTSALSWIDELARLWPQAWQAKQRFAIRHWVGHEQTAYRTLILQNDPNQGPLAEPLINALLGLATASLLGLPDSQTRALWLFLDEMGNLPKNPSLLKWLSLARAKGGRLVMGIQDLAMLQETYGKSILDAKASMIGTLIALRVSGTGDTAGWVAKALGEREVERPQITRQADGSASRGWQHQVLPLVRPADLVGLPKASLAQGITGFLAVGGWNAVHQLTWPLRPLPQIAKAGIPNGHGADSATPEHKTSLGGFGTRGSGLGTRKLPRMFHSKTMPKKTPASAPQPQSQPQAQAQAQAQSERTASSRRSIRRHRTPASQAQ
ncbi:MAG: type IV secretion system DNA-binding domain-containing protein [Gammaproteobacteria bacterium SHHR-1]